MATSNVTTFSMTGDQLVSAALRKISVLGEGQAPSATQLADGTQALNMMLLTFTTKGMPLWKITEQIVSPTASKVYSFGIGQSIGIPAPLKVTQVLLNDTDGSRVPLNQYTHYDYNLLSDSNTTGTPTAYWYEPLNQTGLLHVWPAPDIDTMTSKTFTIVYQKPFDNMVNGTDTLDFPQWWHEAVVYGLAWRLSGDYGHPLADRQHLAKEAQFFLDEATSFGTEEGSLFIQPNWGC